MSGADPEEVVRAPMVLQRWRHVAFLHWRYEPSVVRAVLPRGVEVDTFDGSAWVSITPFRVEGFRPVVLPPLPVLSDYPETNVRTYGRGPDGTDGLWFLSLDVDSLVSVGAARVLLGLPYEWSTMSVTQQGLRTSYVSRRRYGSRAIG